MKIAITGADGFLGSSLKNCLAKNKGLELSILDRNKNDLYSPETLKEFLEGADCVIHLAGANRDTDFNLLKTNTLGTKGLLEGIRLFCKNAKIIFASSVQVYLKQNTYALSKSFAEEIIKYDVVKHQSAAMVFRISNIYGPNARSDYNSVIATFADRIKKNKQLEINGDGSQKRDYVYVDDVVNAIVKAIEAKPKSGIEYLDICSGEETSLRQIISLCEKILAKSLTVSYNKNRPSDNWNLKLNFGRTEKFLNWRAQVDMEEGLKRILLND